MTELERHIPTPANAAIDISDPTGGRLVAWASALDAAYRIGSAICQTEFAPKEFRGKPEAAAAAILHGDELGLSPMQALQAVYVVSGRPGLYARAMVAVVLRAGHEVWTVERSDAKVTVAGRRRGSTHVHEESWTMARAQKAGYTSNRKYLSDPQAMLHARAAADVCRQIAPDALAGLDYAAEELEMMEPASTVSITRSVEPARKAQRKPQPRVAPAEPDLEPAVPAVPVPAEEPGSPELRTEPQMRKLWALAKEHQIGTADDFKAYVTEELGRSIESTKDLTKDEAGRLIEQLETLNPVTGEIVTTEDGA